MSQVLILLRKGLLSFARARAAIAITFLVPIVLIYLFGHVFGLYRKDTGPNGIPLAVVNASPEPAAQQLVDALKAEKAFRLITEREGADGRMRPLTEADVRAALHDNDYRFALILPADLFSDDALGLRMKFLTNPRNEIETQMVTGMLQKTVFSRVPQLLGQALQRRAQQYLGDDRFHQFNRVIAGAATGAFGGDAEEFQRQIEAGNFLGATTSPPAPPADPALRRLDAPGPAASTPPAAAGKENAADVFSRIVKIEKEQVAGKEVKNPMAARTVGGYAIMFLLFAVSGSATTLFEERSSGVFQRLLSSPVRPAHILWARFLFGMILGLVQISALFLAGRVFFGLEIFSHAGALLAVALSAAAACSAFGILIAALAPSAAAATGIATFVVISMSAVGGAWFPVSLMPDYIQAFSKLTLVYWAVEGFTDVLWAGYSLVEVLPKVGILSAIAAVVMAVSLWRFNRSRFFE
jgi:ABC-2 type transport system permease protein